ncbi:hypothetical protein BG004_002422 [Podila humilis]|nr:hypothetical protein BG004_002422 [Podila humilis]
MNINAASFSPQVTSGDKSSGGSAFRSNLSGALANEGKKASNAINNNSQRAPLPPNHHHTKGVSSEQQQRHLPGHGKNQRQSNSKRSGNEREPGRGNTNGGGGSGGGGGKSGGGGGSNSKSRSQFLSMDSMVSSTVLSQANAQQHEKGKGNNKKNHVSLNHLLNFSFPEREEPQSTGPVRRRRNANYQPFNKDKFINANFRFLMNPSSNYEVFTMDPDVRVRWEDIEQVLIAVPQSCPICLQPPVAGRITKCGHVYCFSCILHYLALSESNKAWRKCPICWDAIYEKDLKSVRTSSSSSHLSHQSGVVEGYDQGEKEIAKQIATRQEVLLEMRLIQRSMNSTLALPRSKTFPLPETVLPLELRGQPPLEFYPDAMTFSRLMVSTPSRIIAELERDIISIEFSMEEAKTFEDANSQSEEIVFFEMALDKIRERKDQIQEDAKFFPRDALNRERILRHYIEHTTRGSNSPGDSNSNAEQNASNPENIAAATTQSHNAETPTFQDPNDIEVDHMQDGHAVAGVETGTNMLPSADTTTEVDPRVEHLAESEKVEVRQEKVPNQVTSVYYFYQAANGHHLYLQPLDIRILKQHFESYEHFPDSIVVKVIGIEETSLTEEVRKKCKYLGHLPLGCEVSFVDVALEQVVSPETLQPFEPELRLRRTKRREKEAREERERLEREHKLNPPKSSKRDESLFVNDPFFHVDASGGFPSGSIGILSSNGRKNSEADLLEAIRLSQLSLEESMPTLSEAHARATAGSSSSSSSSANQRLSNSNLRNTNNVEARPIPMRTRTRACTSASSSISPSAEQQQQQKSFGQHSSSYESNASVASSSTLPGGGGGISGSTALSSSSSTTLHSHQHSGPSTVWGTPSVQATRHHDDYYDDDYEDEHDYETEVYVKRGKKKVAVLMSNNSRRIR